MAKSNWSGSGTIGGVKVSYSTKNWNTTYTVGKNTYNSASAAANAIKNSSWYSKWGTTNFTSNGKTYSGGSSSSGSSFVDPSVLHDQYMWKTSNEIATKWWGTDSAGNAWAATAQWQKVLQTLNKNNRVYWTGWYTNYNSSTGLYDKPENGWTGVSNTNKTAGQYSDATYQNYTKAYNNLVGKGMDEASARAQASKMIENEDLLGGKTDEQIAAEESQYNQEVADNAIDDLFGEELGEEYTDEMEEDENEQYWNDLIGDIRSEYEDRISDLESKLESNVVKETTPEERDTSYDYNTYFQNNLAPDNNYENWESKDIQTNWLTFNNNYADQATTALQDLGLLTPNQEAATNMPDTAEQPTEPKTYNSADEIINDFTSSIEAMSASNAWMSREALAKMYQEYKNNLVKYAQENNLSNEEYANLLKQMQSNETLRNVLYNKPSKWPQM